MSVFKYSEHKELIYFQDFVTDETCCFYCRKPLGDYGGDKLIVHWMGEENIFFHAECATKFGGLMVMEGLLAERAEKGKGGYPHNKILEKLKK